MDARLASWLWSRCDDWLEGSPGRATLDRLESAPIDDVPEDLLFFLGPKLMGSVDSELGRATLNWMAQAVREEAEQFRVGSTLSRALTDAAVRHVFVKGSDLRYRLYDDPIQRVSCDIDLLVDPDHRQRALELARDLGAELSSPAAPFLAGKTHRVDLRVDGTNIDMHVSMVQSFRDHGMHRGVLEDREWIEVAGTAWPVPSRLHAIALCLVHIGRHEGAAEYVLFKHGLDILMACTRWDLDWERLGETVRGWRVSRLAGAGLWTWQPHFGPRIPREALNALDPGALLRWLACRTRDVLSETRVRARGSGRASQLLRKWAYAEGGSERRALLRELARRARSGDEF